MMADSNTSSGESVIATPQSLSFAAFCGSKSSAQLAVMFGPYQQGGTVYSGKFDIITFAWQQTPDGDLSNIYDSTQIPPNGQNDLHYKSAKVDALLQKSKAAYDEDERKPIVVAIQKQVMEDVPQIILWVREDIFSYNNDLKNYDSNNTTFFDNMMNVDI